MDKLSSIPTKKLDQAEIAGLARIHLWVTGEIHLRLNAFMRQARAVVLQRAGADGQFDGASGFQAQNDILREWDKVHADVLVIMRAGMEQAARLPFALLAEENQRRVLPLTVDGGRLTEATITTYEGWVEQQFRLLIEQANSRILDGLNLSARVWKMDSDTRLGINNLIVREIGEKQDAWSLARDLEGFLGSSQDCPRWTDARLYGLTKSDIAGGDLSGLLTGKACDGTGVAYKALRLARTEIQAIHAAASTRQMAASPWVLQEKIILSNAHPEPDECDDVTSGGDQGDGAYPVGTITLPLHPQCLCYKVAVTMSDDDFVAAMRGWGDGSQPWPEMDTYHATIGGVGADLSKDTDPLKTWLFGSERELQKVMP